MIFSNRWSFVAVKDSKLDNPPPGCALWEYEHARFALILSNSSATGLCGDRFRCFCASCKTTFSGLVNSSTPGNFSLRVSSSLCPEQTLREFQCNAKAGYERVWDSFLERDICRLKMSHVCKTATLMLGGVALQGSKSLPMIAKITERTDLRMRLADGGSVGPNSRVVEVHPVKAIIAHGTIDAFGESTPLTLQSTGQFEVHIVDGQSSYKLPSQVEFVFLRGRVLLYVSIQTSRLRSLARAAMNTKAPVV